MKLLIDKTIIDELKIITIDSPDKEFIYFDKIKDKTWRCCCTKNIYNKLEFIKENE